MNFDVIVIGSGPGGYVAAIRAAQLGLKTACVEKGPLGGTCLNVGCIPSKTLLHSSELYHSLSHDTKDLGIFAEKVGYNFDKIMERKQGVITEFNQGVDFLFKKNKVTLLKGTGKLVTPTQVEVGQESHRATSIILATGSEPTTLPFLPVDEKRIVTSTGALALAQVPKRLLVIGAGVIGIELGLVYHRLGAKVTFVEFLPRILPSMDADTSESLQAIFEKQGLSFHLGSKVTTADIGEQSIALHIESERQSTLLEGDVVLCSIGRRPFTKGLGLEAAGITTDAKGFIPINGRFQTSVPSIYAIGDIVDGPMLAHKASEEGIAVAEILAGKRPHIEYAAIPSVVYTTPEVAAVGLTEEQARKWGFSVRVGTFPYKANSRAKCMGQQEGKVKIVVDGKTDVILGMHIIGPHASEIIAEGVVAIEKKMKALELASTPHAHPTLSEAVKEAALDVHKRAIHR